MVMAEYQRSTLLVSDPTAYAPPIHRRLNAQSFPIEEKWDPEMEPFAEETRCESSSRSVPSGYLLRAAPGSHRLAASVRHFARRLGSLSPGRSPHAAPGSLI
jgi:hypothetical protein